MFSDDYSDPEIHEEHDTELFHDDQIENDQKLSITEMKMQIENKIASFNEILVSALETKDISQISSCCDELFNLIIQSNQKFCISNQDLINTTINNILAMFELQIEELDINLIKLFNELTTIFSFIVTPSNYQNITFVIQRHILTENKELSRITKILLLNILKTQENASELLYPLYSFIIQNVSPNLVENDIEIQIIHQFVRNLNGSIRIKLDFPKLFSFLAPYFRLGEVDGVIHDVTVYSSWILSDIFAKNTMGTNTPRLAQETQVFVFLASFLNYRDPRILIPVLKSIQYAMTSFPNAEILCTDIQTHILIDLLLMPEVAEHAALCIASIIERRINEECDLDIKRTCLTAFQAIENAKVSTQISLLYLITLCADALDPNDIVEVLAQVNFIPTIIKFIDYDNNEIVIESLSLFMNVYMKLQSINKHTDYVDEFGHSGGFDIIREYLDSDCEELHEIVQNMLEMFEVQ